MSKYLDKINKILYFLLIILLFLEITLFTSIQYYLSNYYLLIAVILLIFVLQTCILSPYIKEIIPVIDPIFYKIHKRFLSLLRNHGFKIFIAYLLLSLILISWFWGIFSDGIITTIDHSWHYYQAWYTANYLIPVFHSVLGWNPYFYAGYPEGYVYMPGMSIFIALLNIGSQGVISLHLSYRLFLFLTLSVTPFSVYILMKKFGFDEVCCSIAGLISFIPTSWHTFFLTLGMIPLVFATGISPLVFAYFHEYFQRKKPSSLLLSIIIFNIILITHYIIALGVFFGLILYISMRSEIMKGKFSTLCFFCMSALMLSAFVIIPTMYYKFVGYIDTPDDYFHSFVIKGLSHLITTHIELILSIPLPAWVFIYLFYREYKNSTWFPIRFILFYSIILYIATIYGSAWFPLWGLELLHLLGYLGLYVTLPLSVSISENIRTMSKQGYFALFTLLMILAVPVASTAFQSWTSPNDKILSIELSKDTDELFKWLRKNSDAQSRVLMELSEITTSPWMPGHTSGLAPIFVGKNVKFIGGYGSYNNFPYSSYASTKEGEFFRISVKDINKSNYERMISRMHEFNIYYIVAWSNISKKFFNKSNDDFEFIEDIGNFSIYRYRSAPRNYIVRIDGNASAEVTDFDIRTIKLNIISNTRSKIMVSSAYFPNWHAYIMPERKEIPVVRNDIFTAIIVPPKETAYTVELVFEEGRLEKYSKFLSIFSGMIIIPLILFLRWRGM